MRQILLAGLPAWQCQYYSRARFIEPVQFLLVTSHLSDLSVMAFSFLGLMEPFATPALALCIAPFPPSTINSLQE